MMEAKTPKEFFEKALPARFKPEKSAGIDVVAQLNITGANGGDWVVIIRDQKLQVKEGTNAFAHVDVEDGRKRFHGHCKRQIKYRKSFFHR